MLEKIKAMKEVTAQMETMQKSIVDECKKDRKQLRWEAFQEINKFLNEVAEALGDDKISVEMPKSLIFAFVNGTYLRFNSTYIMSKSGFSMVRSEESLPWYINTSNGTRNENKRYQFIDGDMTLDDACPNGTWVSGILPLIENWQDIKPIINEKIMKYYTDKQTTIRESTEDTIASYEKVANFKV